MSYKLLKILFAHDAFPTISRFTEIDFMTIYLLQKNKINIILLLYIVYINHNTHTGTEIRAKYCNILVEYEKTQLFKFKKR